MKWLSDDNKFLIIKPGVVLTEHIDPVINALDTFFESANLKTYVTSGLRDANAQLRIIRNELTRRNIAKDYEDAFEDIGNKIEFEGQEVYGWQPGWSRLLNLGFIVNPPYPAKCLFNYYRPGSSQNKIGTIIGSSPHFHGTAFDISGGADGIGNETRIVTSAKVKGLKGCLPERNNNCLHVDCQPIDLTKQLV